MNYNKIYNEIQKQSTGIIKQTHALAKKIWKKTTPEELQNKCLSIWDEMNNEIGSKIIPLIPINENRPVTNLIFGSGSFSTGRFQVQQYQHVRNYTKKPPVILQGIISNKSKLHGCNGSDVAKEFNIMHINLDFIDWYHENINKNEDNPIRATRYWYPPGDKNSDLLDIENRFNIRQNMFHKTLGEKISRTLEYPTDIVSLRGYNFQFCSCIFPNQIKKLPHVNDTHPADLSYVFPESKIRKYTGWQSGATKMMIDDGIKTLRGSLIEVDYMDRIDQIHELDEGVLLALGQGIKNNLVFNYSATEIQGLLKVIDDFFFCTLEPTGLILLWGVTKDKISVNYQDVDGNPIIINQKAVIVGDRVLSGKNAFGSDLSKDLTVLENFLTEKRIL